MQPNFELTAHKLAEILLQGKDFPVVIPSYNGSSDAEFIQNIYVLQNDESPFEYSIFLEGNSSEKKALIEIID